MIMKAVHTHEFMTGKQTPFVKQLKQWYPTITQAKSTVRKFISIHIPRTGGTTFRNLLFYWYGIINVYHDETHKSYIPNVEVGPIPSNIHMFDVIHGHFPYKKYEYMGLPTVVWVRNPVDILISQYYVLKKHNVTPRSPKIHLEVVEKRMGLLEYAEYKGSRNTLHKFIGGVSLDKFAFIGITEHYAHSLSNLRKWNRLPIPNTFPVYNFQSYPDVERNDRETIASFNKKDIELYNEIKGRFGP